MSTNAPGLGWLAAYLTIVLQSSVSESPSDNRPSVTHSDTDPAATTPQTKSFDYSLPPARNRLANHIPWLKREVQSQPPPIKCCAFRLSNYTLFISARAAGLLADSISPSRLSSCQSPVASQTTSAPLLKIPKQSLASPFLSDYTSARHRQRAGPAHRLSNVLRVHTQLERLQMRAILDHRPLTRHARPSWRNPNQI